ncbi:hypothetical protein K8R43_00175 [archaeon]|nr:hypothetical protein [archaeon]
MVDGQARDFLKIWRVRILIGAIILLGIAPLMLMGVKFGMDFVGGTMIQLELDESVDSGVMTTTTTILQERLNRYGMKDISVRPYGDQYITVTISTNETSALEDVKDVLSSQGKFEAIIDGVITLRSEDLVEISTNPQDGYGYLSSTGQWRVPFTISKEGSERFKTHADGKCNKTEGVVTCEKIYMFIDRPDNAILIMPDSLYEKESAMFMMPGEERGDPITIDKFKHNALIEIVNASEVTPELVQQIEQGNYSRVIVHENVTGIELLENKTFKFDKNRDVVSAPTSSEYWLWKAVNLESILNLTPGVTSGKAIREAVIEGHAPDWETASSELTHMVVLLKSGSLPVGISIASTNTVSPTLGKTFINDLITMAVLAWFAVGFIVLLRYRDIKLTALMMSASFSEVLIILGIASLLSWELDIASIAGIIAVVGTGVDSFIIIVDEVKSGSTEEEETVVDKVKKAFRIIFGSAMTTLAAMLPLLTLGLGLMKGFAITTLIGLFVGVVIVRPTFGKIIEKYF